MKYRLTTEPIEIRDASLKMPNGFLKALIDEGILIEEPEFPQENDEYFSISSLGAVFADNWDSGRADLWRKASGNIFKTREQAEKYKADLLAKG